MNMYVITYDLSRPGRNYDGLYNVIKSYNRWARLTESSWAIMTDQGEVALRDALTQVMDANDKLFVGKIVASAWRGVDQEVHNWLTAQYYS